MTEQLLKSQKKRRARLVSPSLWCLRAARLAEARGWGTIASAFGIASLLWEGVSLALGRGDAVAVGRQRTTGGSPTLVASGAEQGGYA